MLVVLAMLWLLPLAAFFGGGLGWVVRFEHAAPGAWIPLHCVGKS